MTTVDLSERRRVVVAITGATGAIFGVQILARLRELDIESHLVISGWGARTIEHETGHSVNDIREMADVVYRTGDQAAAVSSGSFLTEGMIVAPCSVKTLATIATGVASDLVSRAADVTLKEGRRLVLMVREAPLSPLHLENMLKLARLGVSIVPPVPAFYNHPGSVEDVVEHIVTRALDQLHLHSTKTPRWDGELSRGTAWQEHDA